MSCHCKHCKAADDCERDKLKEIATWLSKRVSGDHNADTTRTMLKRKLIKMGIIEK